MTVGEVAEADGARIVEVDAGIVAAHVPEHDARRIGRRVEERHADQVLRGRDPAGKLASVGRSPVRSTRRAPSGSTPVALGRSATRSNSTTSSPTRAAPALMVEMTSMPGCEGATSSGLINGLSASRAPTGTATHSPGRAWVGSLGRRRLHELAHHLDETRAGLRPGELVRVRVCVVLEPALLVGIVEQGVDRDRELVGVAEVDEQSSPVGERLLRVQVRGRDDGLAGAERVAERAARDLVRDRGRA